MSARLESPELFECVGCRLVGMLHPAGGESDMGVLLLVGGPQYRVGAHRMYVKIARRLAQNGIPSLRFDYRGVGDSEGTFRGFEDVEDDIASAVSQLMLRCPEIKRVALFGLCDGATAAALYDPADERVTTKILLNPWVHTHAGEAKAYLSYYYPKRLLQKSFWISLVQGKVAVVESLRDLFKKLYSATQWSGSSERAPRTPYQSRMLANLHRFEGRPLFMLSEHDFTAVEFRDLVSKDQDWIDYLRQSGVRVVDIAGADHTLSDSDSLGRFVDEVLEWIKPDSR